MAKTIPFQHDYLAVVSEWTTTTQRGGAVGNAYPLMNLSTGELVADPVEQFPNPGAIFLTNRGNMRTWDFILLRLQENSTYSNYDRRQCYYIPARQPDILTTPNQFENIAAVLEHPSFDPASVSRQLPNPRHNVTPIFFVQRGSTLFGPLFRDTTHLVMDDISQIQWRPLRDDGIIYEFARDELIHQGIRFATYEHPDPNLNRILANPIMLAYGPVRRVRSARLRDALPERELVEWYLARCPNGEVTAEQFSSLRAAFKGQPGDDPEVQAARLKKVEKVMITHTAFADQRERFAKLYVESDAGRTRIQELLEQQIARRADEIQAEADLRQREFAAKRNALDREIAEAERVHKEKIDALVNEQESALKRLSALEEAASQVREQLSIDVGSIAERAREQLPLLAAFAATRQEATVVLPTAVAAPIKSMGKIEFAPISPSAPVKAVASEVKLVAGLHANLASRGLHFARDFVANVYACFKAEPLNLIIGPPGYGKSMLISGLARALGHGDALLRIAVRRSWSEDRHLLGFYDSFHGRYDPGPTGLVRRMLQAEADWRGPRQGLYVVLLDEFNLAAPEYYFSQLLQTLPSGDSSREIQLYDPSAASADGFPSRLTVSPNLRFWGTINYDETTERLSPRTLDRTGMIFLGDADVTSAEEDQQPSPPGVGASDLFDHFVREAEACPEEHWVLVSKVIDFLRSPDPTLGPRVELSPRVRRGIRRYLANAHTVLDAKTAVDFVVRQRILPVVRGRGEDFASRIERLLQLLSDSNLLRSAAHVEEALRRSQQQFGDLDFLSY